MSTAKNLWIIIALSLLAVGLLIFVTAMVALDFDFTKISTQNYKTNTYEINEDFSKISIDAGTEEIDFVLSDDKQCKIVCFENEKVKHFAAVKDGTLTVGAVDNRKWYDYIGFLFVNSKITVYLPQSEYASLIVEGSTGNINIPKDFKFETVDVTAGTGDVNCYASASESMKIKLSTGAVCVENTSVGTLDLSVTTGSVTASSVNCKGNVNVSVTTGRTELTDIFCKGVISSGSTGSMILKNVIASESFSIERSTGNVTFEGSDAAEIYVRTSTGDVTGTLLSEKVFITKTKTGSVNVPETVSGGRCEIKVSTGDIRIDIQ